MTALGYTRLRQDLKLQGLPLWHTSRLSTVRRVVERADGAREEEFTHQSDPGPGVTAQLIFALKWEGVNLAALADIFAACGPGPVLEAVQATPTGAYARRLAFFYELTTGCELPAWAATTWTP